MEGIRWRLLFLKELSDGISLSLLSDPSKNIMATMSRDTLIINPKFIRSSLGKEAAN
jgi:hypothetical protein